MPQPKKAKETEKEYISRCMSDNEMNSEYPDSDQRYAVCKSKASETIFHKALKVMEDSVGSEEEITEDNFYVPAESEYEDFGETEEEWDVAADRPGLWENIRRKKEREGKNYKPAKPGDPDRPDPDSWKKAQDKKSKSYYKKKDKDKKAKSHDAGSMEDYVFESKEAAEEMANKIGLSGVHSHKSGDNKTLWMPGKNMKEFQDWYEKHSNQDTEGNYKYEDPKTGEIFNYRRKGIYKKDGRTLVLVRAAKYQGRTVKLNKPLVLMFACLQPIFA